MPIAFPCPHCGNTCRSPEQMAGRKTRCSYCHKAISIPRMGGKTKVKGRLGEQRKRSRLLPVLMVVLLLLAGTGLVVWNIGSTDQEANQVALAGDALVNAVQDREAIPITISPADVLPEASDDTPIIGFPLTPSDLFETELLPKKVQSPAKPVVTPSATDIEKKTVIGQRFNQREVGIKEVGRFVVSLARDLQGNVWVGTEDKGVFRYSPTDDEADDPTTGKWTQFTQIGDDNAYAIACDKLGRVWVGTLNHGVNVYTGKEWRNYGILDGPLGERIFAITICPTDGDVWMATSAGLTRYSLKNDAWNYYTRADGLPEDQSNALAFDIQGNIYVGTQCHGIAMAKASDEYKKWSVTSGPSQVPVTPNGTGLPTSLINALLVAKDGTVYAGTTAGLAWSKNKGQTWQYLRGRDYAVKVKGRLGGPPSGWKESPAQVLDSLLPEDYITCVAEDSGGQLWLGFRQQGYLVLDPKSNRKVFQGTKKATSLPDDYVFALLPSNVRSWSGTYGGGLAPLKQTGKGAGLKDISKAVKDVPTLPSPASPPSAIEVKAMVKAVNDLPRTKLLAGYLGDDWTTQGDWVGRYGREYTILCAMAAPLNHYLSWGRDVLVDAKIGPHSTRDDALRHWVHWERTDNPRCLYDPVIGYRRQAEWDDHGEAYSGSHEGPDIWISVSVPEGIHRLTIYVMNKDGHDGMNRMRDYLVQLRQFTGSADERQMPLASCRVRDFWGGVYKKFIVSGPGKYQLKIAKNGSFNTICSSVMVDRLHGPSKTSDDSWLPYMEQVWYGPTPESESFQESDPTLGTACELWRELNQAYVSQGSVSIQTPFRLFAYRSGVAGGLPSRVLNGWRWKLPLWSPSDREEFRQVMARAWGAHTKALKGGN